MMEYSIETIDGQEYIVIIDGNDIHQVAIEALSSWGVLLGLTDHDEIMQAIIKDANSNDVNIDWADVYASLQDNLSELSKSGVPVEFMEDLLDPALGAPVPGPGKTSKLAGSRGKAMREIKKGTRTAAKKVPKSSIKDKITQAHEKSIRKNRELFIDALAPVYELPPELPANPDILT